MLGPAHRLLFEDPLRSCRPLSACARFDACCCTVSQTASLWCAPYFMSRSPLELALAGVCIRRWARKEREPHMLRATSQRALERAPSRKQPHAEVRGSSCVAHNIVGNLVVERADESGQGHAVRCNRSLVAPRLVCVRLLVVASLGSGRTSVETALREEAEFATVWYSRGCRAHVFEFGVVSYSWQGKTAPRHDFDDLCSANISSYRLSCIRTGQSGEWVFRLATGRCIDKNGSVDLVLRRLLSVAWFALLNASGLGTR